MLQDEFLPKEIRHRDREIDSIATALQPILHGEPADDVFLHGPTGVGKTCIARYSMEQLKMEAAVDTQYVNCWNDYTRYRVLYKLLEGVGRTVDIHRSSTPRDVLLDRIQDAEGPYVAVLDEVDQLEDPSVLYDLYTIPHVTVLMIANDHQGFLNSVDDRLESRLTVCRDIKFEPYTVDALVAILEDRVRKGLYPDAVSDRQLERIADAAAGDARVAIGALRVAARTAEDRGLDEITPEVVEDAIPDARKQIRSKTLDSLTEHQMVLYDIVEEHGEADPGVLYEEYESRVDSPKTRRTLRNYLAKMVQYDLLEAEGEGRGRSYRLKEAED